MPPTDDDGPFEVDDLLWLIREMEDQSAPPRTRCSWRTAPPARSR
jgi:hypothetical protein